MSRGAGDRGRDDLPRVALVRGTHDVGLEVRMPRLVEDSTLGVDPDGRLPPVDPQAIEAPLGGRGRDARRLDLDAAGVVRHGAAPRVPLAVAVLPCWETVVA